MVKKVVEAYEQQRPLFEAWKGADDWSWKLSTGPLVSAFIDGWQNPNSRVLELAVGSGRLTTILSQKFQDMTCLEPTTTIEAAQKRAPNPKYLRAIVEDMPFASNSFDLVIGTMFLQHIDDELLIPMFTQLRHLLSSSGYIYLVCEDPANAQHDVGSLSKWNDQRSVPWGSTIPVFNHRVDRVIESLQAASLEMDIGFRCSYYGHFPRFVIGCKVGSVVHPTVIPRFNTPQLAIDAVFKTSAFKYLSLPVNAKQIMINHVEGLKL